VVASGSAFTGDRRAIHAGHVAHAVYGALVATTLIVAADDGLDAGELLESLVATGTALWLAHAFAMTVGRSVASGGHLELRAVVACLREESPLLLGFLLPIPAILLGFVDIVPDARAADYAIGVLLAALLIVGTMLGRSASMPWPKAVMVGTVYPALGAVVILLEIALGH
jgi:hypothetical protein